MLWICDAAPQLCRSWDTNSKTWVRALGRAKANSFWPGGCSEIHAEPCKTQLELLGEMPWHDKRSFRLVTLNPSTKMGKTLAPLVAGSHSLVS